MNKKKDNNYDLMKLTNDDTLEKPGDEISARITANNRKVVKIKKDNGKLKYSATQYPNGTIVETKTTKK